MLVALQQLYVYLDDSLDFNAFNVFNQILLNIMPGLAPFNIVLNMVYNDFVIFHPQMVIIYFKSFDILSHNIQYCCLEVDSRL